MKRTKTILENSKIIFFIIESVKYNSKLRKYTHTQKGRAKYEKKNKNSKTKKC